MTPGGQRQTVKALREAASSGLGDRIIQLAENALGEELDARIRAIDARKNELGFDPFGFDPDVARYMLAVVAFFHRLYFRTEVFNIEHAPHGRALFVANHAGQIPIDGMMIAGSLMLDADPPIFPRSMVERWTVQLPFVSVLFPRVGQVLGSPDNARRLLAEDQSLVVFPEGVRGISKTYDRRYQLADFGLGFMRLALETNTPIVPVGVIGSEEQLPSVGEFKSLAKLLGAPAFPIIPQLFLGAFFPLPTRYRIYFGEPMHFTGDPDEEDADIEARVWQVRTAVQSLVNDGLAAREHVFW